MKRVNVKTIVLTAIPLALLSAAALGGDGLSVNITNDGTEDIVVTVYDLTVGANAVVLSHTRINGFTTVPVSLSPDETGKGNISWTAVSADKSSHLCGHEEKVGLGDSSSVTVHADTRCNLST